MIILYKEIFCPIFWSVKSFWRADMMKTCIYFSKTNFSFTFTLSLTLWFFNFKLSNNAFLFYCLYQSFQDIQLEFFHFEIIQHRHFLITPVHDSQWLNIWSQQRIFKCLFRTPCRIFESSVKINIPISKIQIPLFKAPVKLVLNHFVKNGNVFRKKHSFQEIAYDDKTLSSLLNLWIQFWLFALFNDV